MEQPDKCPHCGKSNEKDRQFWLIRSELDYDQDKPDQIEDQIWECSSCHTLFRLKWKLISFKELIEKQS